MSWSLVKERNWCDHNRDTSQQSCAVAKEVNVGQGGWRERVSAGVGGPSHALPSLGTVLTEQGKAG